ncbi:MAG TPA: glycine cleavage T C-terminal barrel domain-containing protein, partial [Longimicrobiales bacterium]|nr:glycine cleavage T C-terminal barrel domain-containing protein [Longimicrobiales bacterium]
GRQPLEMLQGIVTGGSPESPAPTELGVLAGAATYHTVLTPKGRMLADLHLWREPVGDGEVVRAHLPVQAAAPLREHLTKVLPPRLAKLEDRSADVGMLSLLGPDAARLASGVAMGLRVEARELEEMEEDEFRLFPGSDRDEFLVIRNGSLSVPAFDVVGDRAVLRPMWSLLTGAGAEPIGLEAWDTLRVERGRPGFGTELGPDVIPVEAGIHDRAIDYEKGCYTGQEVIVRIRDRGHVNRHLRLLLLDINAPLPRAGADLYREEERPVGRITTAVDSPRRGKLALAYLRREVHPGQTVHVGSPEGPRARVEALPED